MTRILFIFCCIVLATTLFIQCGSSKKIADNDSESFRTLPEAAMEEIESQPTEDSTQSYFTNNYERNTDYVYDESIKTVRLYPEGLPLKSPVMRLMGGQNLVLDFDYLSGDYQEFRYEIIHCSAQWEKSDLLLNEYFDGFQNNIIEEYEFSNATLTEYIHYHLQFPDGRFKLTKSGNYLIHVYNGDELVITRRFMVVNPQVKIAAEVMRPALVEYRAYRQKIVFQVAFKDEDIMNPSNLSAEVVQNNSLTHRISEITPSYVNDGIAYYEHESTTFDGGNEYRRVGFLETKNISHNIKRVEQNRLGYFDAYMDIDEPRSVQRYLTNEDYNGQRLLQRPGSFTETTQSEYFDIHFHLSYDQPIAFGDLYLYGAFTDWNIDPQYKMEYDAVNQRYRQTAFLKQGWYDYQYVLVTRDNPFDQSFIEGTHYETENDYSILIYYRSPMESYDELLGVKRINSRTN